MTPKYLEATRERQRVYEAAIELERQARKSKEAKLAAKILAKCREARAAREATRVNGRLP